MCSRGVFQLQKLSLFFCDFGGSSQGVRQFLMSQKLKQFMQDNKQINFNFICKRNYHPFLSGVYVNGYIKNSPIRSYTQDEVLEQMVSLRNQLGKSAFRHAGKRTFGVTQSIQGKWTPNLFNTYPIATYQKVHNIPKAKFELIQKKKKVEGQRKTGDIANKILGVRDQYSHQRRH